MADVINTGGEVNSVAPEGHEEAMIAAVEEKEAELAALQEGGSNAPQEEELLLGKFKSADDLAKAYQELERKLSQGGSKQEAPAPAPTEVSEQAAAQAVESAGLDMGTLAAHYEQTGGLADEHYESLAKAGIPREYVDQYIAGVEAQANNVRNSIFAEVGGEENFAAMSQWAVANLSTDEISEYNKAVDSRDPATVRSAVMSLAFRYQREVGSDPKLLRGDNGGNTGGGFDSIAQLTEAMKDPRYDKDPAYRRSIEQKLAKSNIF